MELNDSCFSNYQALMEAFALPLHTKLVNEFKDIQGQHILNYLLDVCILLKPSPAIKSGIRTQMPFINSFLYRTVIQSSPKQKDASTRQTDHPIFSRQGHLYLELLRCLLPGAGADRINPRQTSQAEQSGTTRRKLSSCSFGSKYNMDCPFALYPDAGYRLFIVFPKLPDKGVFLCQSGGQSYNSSPKHFSLAHQLLTVITCHEHGKGPDRTYTTSKPVQPPYKEALTWSNLNFAARLCLNPRDLFSSPADY